MNYDNYYKNAYIPNKEEIKYTQNNYLSKRLLTSKLGGQVIASTWLKVSKFRNKYFSYLPLKNIIAKTSTEKMKIMTPICINKIIKDFEEVKIDCLVDIKSIDKMKLNQLYNDVLIDEIEILLKTNNLEISKKDIEYIIDNANNISLKNVSPEKRFALGIYKILTELTNHNRPIYNMDLIKYWSSLLLNDGEEIIKKEITGKQVYLKKNNDNFEEIVEFIQNMDNYSMPIRITAAFGYCRLGNLFNEKYNDLFALLTMYYVLSENNYEIFKYLRFTQNLINKNLQFLIDAFSDTNLENGDLTYILNVLVDNYYISLNELSENLKNIKNLDKNNESIISKKEPLNILYDHKEIKDANYYMSKYPLLSRKQVIFFISHCKPDRYYSVKNFQKYCNSVQETARYSMKNLVKNGLYLEMKIGKKFLYQVADNLNDNEKENK